MMVRAFALRPVIIVMALLAFTLGLGAFRYGGYTGHTLGLGLGVVTLILAAALIYLHNHVVFNATSTPSDLPESGLRPPRQS